MNGLGIKMFDWEKYAMDFCGYKMVTTFGMDFDIADAFGVDAIRDTYKRAFNDWKRDIKYITELNLITNWKHWQYAETNREYAEVYAELYYKLRDYIFDNFEGDELMYYIRTTD